MTGSPGRVVAGALGTVAAVGAACVGYGIAIEARAFTLRRFRLPVLPAGHGPVRILHLSDLHLVPGQRAKQDWVKRLSALDPDLVVNTGDNMASVDALPAVVDTYRDLLERPGVFVFGSNDYGAPVFKSPLRYLHGRRRPVRVTQQELPWREMRQVFVDAGWRDLTHQRHTLELDGLSVEFRGTDDAHLRRDDYSTVAGPPAAGTDLAIGVTHAPYLRVLDAMAADGLDLILAGHTHGGQVCVPGYGALVTNCDLDTGRVKGLHSHTVRTPDGERTSALHVSAGLGMSPFAPYRFACRPEATLLTLTER